MQFQIPQFIETEDKIVGPLTLRQFFYVGGAIGLSLFSYFILNAFAWFFLSVLLVGAGLTFAFFRVNGRSLERILFAALGFLWRPQTYVWQPEHPDLPKDASTLRHLLSDRFSLESIFEGLALRRARERVLTGGSETASRARRSLSKIKERYEIVRRLTGERKAMRRIDYR